MNWSVWSRFSLVAVLLFATGCGFSDCLMTHKDKRNDPCQENLCQRDCVPTFGEPILEAARCVTTFEDDLRMDGTISVKSPDVWSDSNLMHSIQEFDKELESTLGEFKETIQAFIANSDRAGGQSETTLAISLDPTTTGTSEAPAAPAAAATPAAPQGGLFDVGVSDAAFAILSKLPAFAQPKTEFRLEPTQRERQHATYVSVNQSLRRRNMAGDNTRKAGYGLYMFRIPVSVIPGEETSQGYSAVANFRARLVTTPSDVKHTLPRMAIADLVEAMAKGVHSRWDAKARDEIVNAELKAKLADIAKYEKEKNVTFNSQVSESIKDLQSSHPFLTDATLSYRAEQINQLIEQQIKEFKNQSQSVSKILDWARSLNSYQAVAGASIDSIEANRVFAEVNQFGVTSSRLSMISDADINRSLGANQGQFGQVLPVVSAAILRNAEIIQQDIQDDAANLMLPLNFAAPVDPPPGNPALVQQVAETGTLQLAKSKFKVEDFDAVHDFLRRSYPSFGTGSTPQIQEIRKHLFDALVQVNINLQRIKAYSFPLKSSDGTPSWILLEADAVEYGAENPEFRENWLTDLALRLPNAHHSYKRTAWLLARQAGLVDLNIKRMLEELVLRGDLNESDCDNLRGINFFDDQDVLQATHCWQKIVETQFPLQVFTLEPLVEEQNLVDALSRMREMQVALALSVAQGGWNVGQRVALARELALDMSTIGVNRTSVGFLHGMDSFGWYFHPRVQPPRVDKGNLKVFGQLCRRTGPTRSEDRSSYQIEPGVRECEVLIAMPSFVSRVEFDVTTNWESLACPGRSKRSYEEMVLQGCKLQNVRCCLEQAQGGGECRPGDIARLYSRVEQFEQMLGMQTLTVNVPFEYDQPATELFDQGDQQLEPEINGVYGVENMLAKDGDDSVTAEFFVSGRNFHPTLTHVIVSGHESHSSGDADDPEVEIINRELIRVRTMLKTDKMAGDSFEIRVGTPGGLSNPATVTKFAEKKTEETKTKSPFDWKVQPKFTGFFYDSENPVKGTLAVALYADNEETSFEISSSDDNPLSIKEHFNVAAHPDGVEFRIEYEVEFADKAKTKRKFSGEKFYVPLGDGVDPPSSITRAQLLQQIKSDLELSRQDPNKGLRLTDHPEGKITGTTHMRLDNWPLIKFDNQVEINLKPRVPVKQEEDETTSVSSATGQGTFFAADAAVAEMR